MPVPEDADGREAWRRGMRLMAALPQVAVKISGFGTFVLRDKGERVGRNPKTGVEVPIAPRRVLTFRASQMMRDRKRQVPVHAKPPS